MEISLEFEEHLQIADQKDHRVKFIWKRVKNVLAKSDFAKKKYEEITHVRHYVSPAKLHKARVA